MFPKSLHFQKSVLEGKKPLKSSVICKHLQMLDPSLPAFCIQTYLEATDSVHLQTQVTFEIAQDARQTMQF